MENLPTSDMTDENVSKSKNSTKPLRANVDDDQIIIKASSLTQKSFATDLHRPYLERGV